MTPKQFDIVMTAYNELDMPYLQDQIRVNASGLRKAEHLGFAYAAEKGYTNVWLHVCEVEQEEGI